MGLQISLYNLFKQKQCLKMKKKALNILQVCLSLIGIIILYLLIRLPQIEGRAQHLDLFSIYTDPFILYGYVTAIPFFIGLYKLIVLLNLLQHQNAQKNKAILTIKNISFCAYLFAILIAIAALYIGLNHHPSDDPAGFLMICFLICTLALGLTAILNKIEINYKLNK